MKKARFLLAAAVVVAALAITGCGGGGGGGGAITGGTGVLTIIGADAGGGVLTRSRDGVINAPLDDGAKIEAFDFTDGTKLATGTIKSGKGRINLPAGKTVVVIVTGTRNGKQYRLSLIIPCTSQSQAEYIANPATTIAAEAIAQKFYKQGKMIDDTTWQNVLKEAQDYIDANPTADVSIGGGLIAAGKAFGEQGSINEDEFANVVAAVPDEINDKLVKAKNAVLQIKQAGVPFKGLLNDELADIALVAQSTGKAIENANLHQYGEKYRQMAERMNYLMVPAIAGGFGIPEEILGIGVRGVSIMDLEVGKAYRVVGEEDGLLLLEQTTGAETGKVKITRVEGTTTYVLRGTPTSTSWTLVQTSSADASLNYTVALAESPTPRVNVSLRDRYVTTPLTFSGTLAIEGPTNAPTSVTFNGTLGSAELTASGTAAVKFPAVPQGRQEEMRWPNEIDLALNSSKFSAGGVTSQASGTFVMKLTTELFEIGAGLPRLPLPTEISLSNASLVVNAGGHVSSVSGSGVIKLSEYESGENSGVMPTEFTINNFSASLDGKVTASGKLSVKGVVPDRSESPDLPWITDATLEGTFTNKHNGTSLTGTLTGKWNNPGSAPNEAEGTVTATGTLKRANYEDFTVSLQIQFNGDCTADLTVTKIGWTNAYMAGTGTLTLDENGDVTQATLSLTNQAGVKFDIDQDYNGAVTIDGEEVATISKDGTAAKVTYSDDTYDYLFGAPELT